WSVGSAVAKNVESVTVRGRDARKETTMKTLQVEQLSPQLRRVEEGFAALVHVLFRAYPELLCFSLGGRADLPPGVELGDSDAQIFITDVDFAKPVSQEYQNEIGEALG